MRARKTKGRAISLTGDPNVAKIESFDCRICDAKNLFPIGHLYGAKGKTDVPLYKCSQCKSYFTLPTEYRKTQSNEWADGVRYFLALEEESRNWAKAILSTLYGKGRAEGKTFLDIGCGIGWSLVEAEAKGFQAHGIEPLKEVSRYAQEVLRLRVLNEYFSSTLFDENYFDFIMTNQVFEHVYEPKQMFLDSVRLLKVGGILLIGVPPVDWLRLGLDRMKISKSRRANIFYDPDEHINYFSVSSIKALVQNSNVRFLGRFHANRVKGSLAVLLGLSTGFFLFRKIG